MNTLAPIYILFDQDCGLMLDTKHILTKVEILNFLETRVVVLKVYSTPTKNFTTCYYTNDDFSRKCDVYLL